MENILAPINVVIAELGKFKVSVNHILKEIAERDAAQDARKEEQDKIEADLLSREKEVKKIEDIAALKVSTQELISRAEAAAKELLEARKNFNEEAVKKNKEIADAQAKNRQDQENNARDTAALAKRAKELEEEKQNFKLKLAQGLVKQADKI